MNNTNTTTNACPATLGRIVETRVFSARELKEHDESAFNRALENYRNDDCSEIPWQDETIDSLKTLLKRAGIMLKDWSLGAYNRGNFISIELPGGDATEELSGGRAMAWLENNLLSGCRIPWTGKGRNDVRKYGTGYRPGNVRPCPFTGYCADEDYLEALQKSIRSGDTLKDAFTGLADVCGTLLERDAEDQASEEYFLDHAEANEWQFEEDESRF